MSDREALTPRELAIIRATAEANVKAEAEQRRKERERPPRWIIDLGNMLTKWAGF